MSRLLHRVAEQAAHDGGFRRRLLADPHTTLAEAGIPLPLRAAVSSVPGGGDELRLLWTPPRGEMVVVVPGAPDPAPSPQPGDCAGEHRLAC